MAAESEVIQKLRYQVDNYDEQRKLLQDSEKSSEEMASDSHQHIQLCSPDRNRTTISAYSITLHQEHGITDFLESLSSLFKRSNWNSDIYSSEVSFDLRFIFLQTNKTDNPLSFMSSYL
jgi:hypothetical protein